MADNYLERRMEEYRAGKLVPKRRAVSGSVSRKEGDFILSFDSMNVIVLGGSLLFASAVVEVFRKVNCRVALCHSEEKKCRELAQRSGCRYYPFDPDDGERRDYVIDDVMDRWGSVDVVVDLRAVDGAVEGELADNIAKLILLHSHPDFSFISYAALEPDS